MDNSMRHSRPIEKCMGLIPRYIEIARLKWNSTVSKRARVRQLAIVALLLLLERSEEVVNLGREQIRMLVYYNE